MQEADGHHKFLLQVTWPEARERGPNPRPKPTLCHFTPVTMPKGHGHHYRCRLGGYLTTHHLQVHDMVAVILPVDPQWKGIYVLVQSHRC